jgi:hypothetical protein
LSFYLIWNQQLARRPQARAAQFVQPGFARRARMLQTRNFRAYLWRNPREPELLLDFFDVQKRGQIFIYAVAEKNCLIAGPQKIGQ